MELKRYQERVLGNLRSYIGRYAHYRDARRAYDGLLAAGGVTAGKNGVPAYADELGGVPKVCIKVPTGGGKTFIAANALGAICDGLPERPADVVVWLVPRKEILRQTYRQLFDPANPLRMAIDRDFAHRVEVLDKEDGLRGRGFSRLTVEDQLTVFVLSYDSFKKTRTDRRAYLENSALAPLAAYQKTSGQAVEVDGADDTALITALAGTNPIVIVDESHHAKSDLSLGMLRNLNPRFVLELTATPRPGSNVISRVKASELKAEQMVKLPVIVYRRHDKFDVIQDAFLLQRRLEQEARAAEEAGGGYIRPIVLLQAERRGSDDAETYGRLKAKLVEAGIPAEQIAVRTGDVDELGDADLMSRACPIRYIITVEALAEGWDCPFAYVLATVANKSSKVSVEQLVGRILRQPYARRSAVRALNISYVLTSSADFNDTIDQVVAGLNGVGFSKHDVAQSALVPPAPPAPPAAEPLFTGDGPAPDGAGEADSFDDFSFSLEYPTGDAAGTPSESAEIEPTASDGIGRIIKDAERMESEFEERSAAGDGHAPSSSTGIGEATNEYKMRPQVSEGLADLAIPQFRCLQRAGLFSDEESLPFDRRMLLENFDLAACGTAAVTFDSSGYVGARQVDVSEDSDELKVKQLGDQQAADMRGLFSRYSPESKRNAMRDGLINCMSSVFRNTYGDHGLRVFTERAVSQMDSEQVDAYFDNASAYARAIVNAVQKLAGQHCRAQFDKRLASGSIELEPCYRLPSSFVQMNPLTIYDRTLYAAEDGDMNGLEREMAETLANSASIRWWHRVDEAKKGVEFCINGFINHYPDFLAMTAGGRVLAIETKGEQLKNDDSRDKLSLGSRWAMMAGSRYRYFMVFDHDAIDADGSYTLAEFREILAEME